MRNLSIFSLAIIFYFIFAVLYDFATADDSETSDFSEPKIYLIRKSEITPFSDDLYAKRALPYSVFEKRAPIPYSGGIYGKRSLSSLKRARELPFSGGIYGKRAAVPFSGGIYGKRSGGGLAQFKRNLYVKTRSMPLMPLSGGIYGRK